VILIALPSDHVFAQKKERKPVVVSFGQPNIWSLEQAHYLLARMHMANLDLQAKALTETELDPNVTHATRIEILKQFLGIQAAFDQGVGFQNQRLVETARFNDTRRRELTTNRDGLRAQSMQLSLDLNQLRRDRASVADATSDRAKQLDAAIKQKEDDQTAVEKQITFQDSELQKLGAEPSGTPAAAALPTPSSSPVLPSSLLDKLTDEEVKKLLSGGRDPKLNATTMLDNTVQLQYEIIAKQLSLLRDEVGPGERLVFLELPQSIYTTPGPGDEKMAQTWWHVNGYTRTDPLLRLLLELLELEQQWYDIQQVEAYIKRKETVEHVSCDMKDEKTQAEMKADPITGVFIGLRCERESARKSVLDKLYREANSVFFRVEQNGARDTSEMVEAIRKMIAVSNEKSTSKDEGNSARTVVDVMGDPGIMSTITRSASQQKEESRREKIKQMKATLLKILSEDKPLEPANDKALQTLQAFKKDFNIKNGSEFERGIEFIRLDEDYGRGNNDSASRSIERRTVRTVDIIPRQSSLNVNDIQETVKATGILAAFKFLFGFAGQVNFQRQSEQFEQFVHQELYASGFGKGNRDFGWTFGALPGTKRVAPGVRTTYAAMVVPDDAESIVLSARGCYFPRKSYQPLDFEDTGHSDWADDDKFRRYNCGDDQTYIIPIPGGGETSNFWVTNVDYVPAEKGSDYVTVSVRGNNFSSQMGVLVNGVALDPTVGLAQPNLMPRRTPLTATATPTPAATTDKCQQGICGRHERIDPEQIVFSFRMPDAFKGTPTITLIAPGKSVDINSLPNLRINGEPNASLRDERIPFMFGNRATLSIADLQLLNVTPGSASVVALLTGTGFKDTDSVFVNGMELTGPGKLLRSSRLYRLQFNLPADENLMLTVAQDKEAFTKSIPNPAALKITNTTVLSYEPAVNKKSSGVLVVKLQGTGFSPRLIPQIEGEKRRPSLVNVSPTEAIITIIAPKPLVILTLTDIETRGVVHAVIQRPPPAKDEGKG
jgi:hypothetical protein